MRAHSLQGKEVVAAFSNTTLSALPNYFLRVNIAPQEILRNIPHGIELKRFSFIMVLLTLKLFIMYSFQSFGFYQDTHPNACHNPGIPALHASSYLEISTINNYISSMAQFGCST
jgi:hypothetical protein